MAIRTLITKLKPFNLTKAEALMIVNLGIGLDAQQQAGEEGRIVTVKDDGVGDQGEELGKNREEAEYGARALLDTVIEDREEGLSSVEVGDILRIVRETLGMTGVRDTA
jgi:hypothetical protein